MNKIQFKTRKEVIAFLKEKNIDTTNWTEEQWQSINKSQAEIHMQALAESMYDAMNESTPIELKAGEWHMPYGDNIDLDNIESLEVLESTLLKVSTARCARLSYQTVGDNPKIDYGADIRLHDILLESKHMSPFEHCAQAVGGIDDLIVRNDRRSRNFKGFIQYREIVETFNI